MEPPPSAPHRDRHRVRHPWLTGILLLFSAILAVPVFVALYQALDVFGLPGALGILIAISAILAVAWVVHLVRTFGGTAVLVARSVLGSIGHGLQGDPYVEGAGRRLARPMASSLAFARRRLDPRSPDGLFLTTSAVVIALLIALFAEVTFQVLDHGALVLVDTRLANLVDLVHRGEALRAATFFTLIGGAPVRIPLTIALFGILWWRRPNLRSLIALVLVLVLGPLLSDGGRQLVRRPRPPVGASALPGSFSFPSGHAAAAASAFGYLAYLAVRSARRLRWQIAISALAALAILGVAYSRVVLGFHWASDVLAGTVLGLAVAAGAALFAGIRTGRELRWPRRIRAATSPNRRAAMATTTRSCTSTPSAWPIRSASATPRSGIAWTRTPGGGGSRPFGATFEAAPSPSGSGGAGRRRSDGHHL